MRDPGMELMARLKRMDVDNLMYNAVKMQIADYKKTLASNHSVWEGTLIKGMYPKRLGRGRWTVRMPKYGEALDHMRPHFTSLKKGRKMRRWFEARVGKPFPGKTAQWVEARPFMASGDRNFLGYLYQLTLAEVNKLSMNVGARR